MKKQKLLTSFFSKVSQNCTSASLSNEVHSESQSGSEEPVNHAEEQPPVSDPKDISKDKDGKPVQPRLKTYPRTLIGNKNRSFSSSWFEAYPFLEYSVQSDQVYCFICRHFSPDKIQFVTGYCNWKHMSEHFKKHFLAANSPHHAALEKYIAYERSQVLGSVATQLNSQHKASVQTNRLVLCAVVQVILLCAQQEIALRGHRENDDSNNRGNFLEVLALLKANCPELGRCISEMPNNARYTSASIQNEIIQISKSLVLQMIGDEGRSNLCFSVIADETRDKGTEQLSVCIRYVEGVRIRERFIGFMDLDKFDAAALTKQIVSLLDSVGLKLINCLAQSYDGASVMSGDVSGVHARLEELVGETCPYIHCYAHRLNLVLVDCCTNVTEIRDLLGLLQSIYVFQCNSALRAKFFEQSQVLLQLEVLKIPQACETRWYSKKKGIHYFRMRLDAVVIALEEIANAGKPDEVAQSKGFLHQLKSFKIILFLIVMDEVLAVTNALSEYLQCPELIHTRAVKLCKSTIVELQKMRDDQQFEKYWKEACDMCDSIFVNIPNKEDTVESGRRKVPSKKLAHFLVPSTTGSRSTDALTVYQHLRGIYFQVVENFTQEMNRRLVTNDRILETLDASDPGGENFLDNDIVISFCSNFRRFGIDEEAIKSELAIAKNLLISESVRRCADCYSYLLKMKKSFPNVLLYFKLILSFPVSSATCERSFSCLKRVKTYLRTTMKEDRLTGLAILSIEKDLASKLKHRPELVVDEFGKNLNRRISFTL